MLTSRSPGRAAGSLITLVLVAFLLSAVDTSAQAGEQADEGETGRMVLVLDSSGSMKERTAGGQTKIAAAKAALDTVIGSLPEEQAVGLRVYGAKVFSRDDPGACTDSQLAVPVETGNRDALRAAVEDYRPYGETPIGYALQQAGKDLGNEGKRTIVLVSDGEPTCAPDPCKVARDLSKNGIDLRIDVVGLDVDGNARGKLQCIAAAGNGSYYDADSAENLASSLVKLATRAARPFTASGQPVRGTDTPEGAPTIGAGDWLDEIGGPGETSSTRHYVIARENPGSTIHASATVQTTSGATEFLDLSLTTPDGKECDLATGVSQLGGGQLLAGGTSASTLSPFGDADPNNPCAQSETLLYTVEDRPSEPVTTPRPLELRVIEEPPVAGLAGLPEPVDDPKWTKPAVGSPTETTGGSSFKDAALLEPGTYRDNLVPGEVLTYQVDVEWGQQLAAFVEFPKADAKLGSALGRSEILSKLQVFSPGREDVTDTADTGNAVNPQSFMQPEAIELGASTAPATYLSRAKSDPLDGTGLAGRYTVSVFLEEDPEDGSYIVPFTLTVDVTGAARSGPEYVEPEEPQESPTAAPSPEASQPPSAGETDSASGDDAGGSGAGLVLGGLGLAALAGAGYLIFRSRSAGAGNA